MTLLRYLNLFPKGIEKVDQMAEAVLRNVLLLNEHERDLFWIEVEECFYQTGTLREYTKDICETTCRLLKEWLAEQDISCRYDLSDLEDPKMFISGKGYEDQDVFELHYAYDPDWD